AGVRPLLFGTWRHEPRQQRLGSDPCCSGRASTDRAWLATGAHNLIQRHEPVEGEGDAGTYDSPLLELHLRAERRAVVRHDAPPVDEERRVLNALARYGGRDDTAASLPSCGEAHRRTCTTGWARAGDEVVQPRRQRRLQRVVRRIRVLTLQLVRIFAQVIELAVAVRILR